MGLTKQESNVRRRQALRRRQEFAALAADLREGRLAVESTREPRKPIPAIECALATVRSFPNGRPWSRPQTARGRARGSQAEGRAALSASAFVDELNRRLAEVSSSSAVRFVVVGDERATWQGDQAMRPLVARLVAEVQAVFGLEIPFYAQPLPLARRAAETQP